MCCAKFTRSSPASPSLSAERRAPALSRSRCRPADQPQARGRDPKGPSEATRRTDRHREETRWPSWEFRGGVRQAGSGHQRRPQDDRRQSATVMCRGPCSGHVCARSLQHPSARVTPLRSTAASTDGCEPMQPTPLLASSVTDSESRPGSPQSGDANVNALSRKRCRRTATRESTR
jgi:hypothetical protein